MENIINNIFSFFNNLISNLTVGKDQSPTGQNTMRTLKLYKYLEQEEGRKSKPYMCRTKHLTIGVGHNIDANGLPHDIAMTLIEKGEITEPQIDILLASDVKNAIKGCRNIYGRELFDMLSEIRQAVLISMVFQIGEKGVAKFLKTNEAIKQRAWSKASDMLEQSKWARRQTPRRANRAITMFRENKWLQWNGNQLIEWEE